MPLNLKETNISNEHNMLKNPSWRLWGRPVGYLQAWLRSWSRVNRETTSANWPVQDLNPWHPDTLTTQPRSLHSVFIKSDHGVNTVWTNYNNIKCVIWFMLLGRVVRKPVNPNQGLKVNPSMNFSSIKMFSTAYILYSLRLLKLKTEGQPLWAENLTGKLQN